MQQSFPIPNRLSETPAKRDTGARIVATRMLKSVGVVTALTGLLACGQSEVSRSDQPEVSRSQLPEGWNDAVVAAYKAIDDGNATAAAAIFEKFVASDPGFDPAHEGLADAHKAMAVLPPSPERTRHLELAAAHYRRAFDLQLAEKPPAPPRVADLLGVFDRDRLNRPGEREAIMRELIKRYPASVITHLQFIESLLRVGKLDEMDDAIRAAGEQLPPSDRASAQHQIISLLTLTVSLDSVSGADRTLTPSDAGRVLRSALALLDEVSKTAPATESANLLQEKSNALRVLARLEPDARRGEALLKESADLQSKADALRAAAK